ncbi:hypothetical protein N2601_29725 (plasmid) [Rhizobium sp. CB3060]|uniref:hypothetical protein n=1 Tax=Rhizobium sp. CB3060 TaxID=3138255 RepID=UPI0021A2D80D|nr:hypothetical protein [Rhizobium tropici]UWU25636.1 hypothetical protein N2601_29725 [Rhizobium tropici]
MNDLENQLPRIFQINLHRLYQRVIAPVLENLPEPTLQEITASNSMSENLDRAAAQVDAHTHNEATKAFVLAFAGLFERQLRHWALHLFSPPNPRTVYEGDFAKLLDRCLEAGEVDGSRDDVRKDLVEAVLVANVVRHGDGRTSKSLRTIAPELWVYDPSEYVDINAGPSPDSEQIRVRTRDVQRYIHAGLRFWGRVDPLPMAVTEPPF